MSSFYIRLYKDSDYHIVRDIFARGTREHTAAFFRRTLGLPQVWIPSLVVTWLPLPITGSFFTSLLVATIILGLVWFLIRHLYSSYVTLCLRDDMLDIEKYYLQGEDRCFWVAESDGEIVGTVAAAPLLKTGEETPMELKRLSVTRRHRRKGIAQALCRAVIDFAHKGGYKAVVLDTSPIQISSWKLYEKLGFKRMHFFYPDHYFVRYIDFMDVHYRYDIPTQE